MMNAQCEITVYFACVFYGCRCLYCRISLEKCQSRKGNWSYREAEPLEDIVSSLMLKIKYRFHPKTHYYRQTLCNRGSHQRKAQSPDFLSSFANLLKLNDTTRDWLTVIHIAMQDQGLEVSQQFHLCSLGTH